MRTGHTTEYNFDGLIDQKISIKGEYVFFVKKSKVVDLATGTYFHIEPSRKFIKDLKTQKILNWYQHGVYMLQQPLTIYGVVEALNSINILTMVHHENSS